MSSNNNSGFDIFDPTGIGKQMRDASLDAYAKMMVELVNTEAYAESTGAMLDSWLSSSAPFRKVVENVMSQSLANLKLAGRDDITSLAERLTNIEMRLDDMDAKLDAVIRLAEKNTSAKKSKSNSA